MSSSPTGVNGELITVRLLSLVITPLRVSVQLPLLVS
ncbi:MAG: hypothetical protein AW09_004349 [Candidatus Accumulibacter phosphatis]|uniref:Uncharacterized protein n=1 Tax=Candidatus Accumulibacter phosphatis TaxID=327160 RepID=A0A080LSS5_9PROT|nr:MAG: hypothetical protein AW09_004349 [Candidatus Accumulibacter phosphatis]